MIVLLCNNNLNEIELIGIGGNQPYRYGVSGEELTDFPFININNYDSTITFTVQDDNGCLLTDTFLIYPRMINAINKEIEYQFNFSRGVESIKIDSVDFRFSRVDSIYSYRGSEIEIDRSDNSDILKIPKIYSDTVFTIVSTNSTCNASLKIIVDIDREIKKYIPNSFSPNDDGVNDVFSMYHDDNQIEGINKVSIFSRWGDLIFTSLGTDLILNVNRELFLWDGKSAPSGVYMYILDVRLIDGTNWRINGEINLLR